MRTAFDHELTDPKAKINLVKSNVRSSSLSFRGGGRGAQTGRSRVERESVRYYRVWIRIRYGNVSDQLIVVHSNFNLIRLKALQPLPRLLYKWNPRGKTRFSFQARPPSSENLSLLENDSLVGPCCLVRLWILEERAGSIRFFVDKCNKVGQVDDEPDTRPLQLLNVQRKSHGIHATWRLGFVLSYGTNEGDPHHAGTSGSPAVSSGRTQTNLHRSLCSSSQKTQSTCESNRETSNGAQ